jgi:hypothetical protein
VTCDSAGFATKGLKVLHDDDNPRGVPSAAAAKLRKLLFALETAGSLDQVGRFDEKTNAADDLDLIDYH